MDIATSLVRAAADHSDHDHGSHSDHAESGGYCETDACLRNWKIGFGAILFAEGVIFGMVALALRKFACLSTKKFRTLLSYVNVGGGGIFLAAGLLHIIPEALEFFAGGHSEEGEAHGDHGDHDVHSMNLAADAAAGYQEAEAGGHSEHEEGGHGFPTGFTVILATFVAFLFFDRILFTHHNHNHSEAKTVDVIDEEEPLDETAVTEEQKLNGFSSSAFITATAVTVGIGAHSVLEGVAMGAGDEWSTVFNLFIAVFAHRWATAMALGSRFATGNLSILPYAFLVVVFSLVAPLGIGIGFSVKHLGDLFLGIVFAISGGIFIYVGAFEVPAEEFVENQNREHRYGKFITYALGAGIIVGITGILQAAGVAHAH